MTKSKFAIILPDIRSAQNVGAILRTADAAGASLFITAGYTAHPRVPDDSRPPHVIAANARAIAKTALGAEQTVPMLHFNSITEVIDYLQHNQYIILGLEQAENAINLFNYQAPDGRPLALIVGNEVDGLDAGTLAACDIVLEIPMVGRKESLNVAVAAGIAMYRLKYGQNSGPAE